MLTFLVSCVFFLNVQFTGTVESPTGELLEGATVQLFESGTT